MAAAPHPDAADVVLRSTSGKANFQRLARLLISGGTTLLRAIFDQIYPPSNLPTALKNTTKVKQLKAANLTKPQWDCLYPSPGGYGKSTDFDVTLLFKLLRTICNLTPPTKGWDALPASTEQSLAADLARIKYYRNSVYGHVNRNMEITDDDFPQLWQEIREALVAIAGQISLAKKTEWKKAIDNFLQDPLTAEDKRNVEELLRWYRNDMEVKESVDELKVTTHEGFKCLEAQQKNTTQVVQESLARLETSLKDVEGKADIATQDINDMKDMLRQVIKLLAESCQSSEGEFEVITTSFRNQRLPRLQDILSFIALESFQVINPSKQEELNFFLECMEKVRKVLILDVPSERLIMTEECGSLEILERLCKDFKSGRLNEMAQQNLVTEYNLTEVGLKGVNRTTPTLDEEFIACQEHHEISFVKERNELQHQFLHWARIRKRTRALLTQVKTELSSTSLQRKAIQGLAGTCVIVAGVVSSPFTLGMPLGACAADVTLTSAAAATGAVAVTSVAAAVIELLVAPAEETAVGRLNRQKIDEVNQAIDQDKMEGQKLEEMLKKDVLGKCVAEFAVLCSKHIDSALCNRLVEDEFVFLLDILRGTRSHRAAAEGEVPPPAIPHEEVKIHFERVSNFLEQLQHSTNNNEASRITQQILDEMQECPSDEEIKARDHEFYRNKVC